MSIKDDGIDLSKAAVEAVQSLYPQIFRLFYPRIYENVGTYHSPKVISAYMATAAVETSMYGLERAPTAYKIMMGILSKLLEKRIPTMFISASMVKAVRATEFEGDIDWNAMKLPYEAGVFVLPRGALIHPKDGECCCILYGRIPAGDYRIPVPNLPEIRIANDAFNMMTLCPQAGIWYDSVLTKERRPTVKLRNLFYLEEGQRTPKIELGTPLDVDLTLDDEQFLQETATICLGTLMVMAARPALVSPGTHRKTISGAHGPREFWSPNIVGKDYVVRGEAAGGSHRSPRMHWRRGHLRNQAVGAGRVDRKLIWLEPMLVSG